MAMLAMTVRPAMRVMHRMGSRPYQMTVRLHHHDSAIAGSGLLVAAVGRPNESTAAIAAIAMNK